MKKSRFPLFDSIRGGAMILMALYHFSFDLNQFGVIHQDFNNQEFWLNFRALIMTLFLSLVGVSLFLSQAHFQSAAFRSRLKKIGLCALLVSGVSIIANPQTWIFFGILHFIFIASLLGPWLIKKPWLCGAGGLSLVALPLFFRHPFFHQTGWILSGLSPVKPITEDFAPLTPWLGVVAIGILIGFLAQRYQPEILQKQQNLLSKLGHRSLLFYMTHQLVLFPLAWLISQF